MKYGMIKFNEITDFKGYYIPYIYRIDDPVSSESITELVIQNRAFGSNEGRRLRLEAAIAVNSQIEDSLEGNKISNLQFEIEEKATKDRDPSIEREKFQVTRDRERGAPQEPVGRSPISMVTDFIRAKPKKQPTF